MSGLPGGYVTYCPECLRYTDHYVPDDWQWRVAAGDRAGVCLVCEDRQVTP